MHILSYFLELMLHLISLGPLYITIPSFIIFSINFSLVSSLKFNISKLRGVFISSISIATFACIKWVICSPNKHKSTSELYLLSCLALEPNKITFSISLYFLNTFYNYILNFSSIIYSPLYYEYFTITFIYFYIIYPL